MSPTEKSTHSAVQLKELPSTHQHVCCAYGNIVLMRSLCAPDAAYLSAQMKAILRHGKLHPEGLGGLIIVDENAAPPSETERTEIRAAFETVREVMRGGVQVVEGSGFAAAAKRGALMLMNLSGGTAFPMKVAGSVVEATAVLTKLLGRSMDPRIEATDLTRIAEQMRVRLRGGESS